MAVFPLLLTPLCGFLMVSLYRISMENFKVQLVLFAKGLLSFLPAYLIIVVLRRALPFSYRPAYLYFSVFVEEHFLYFVILMGAFILFRGIVQLYRTSILDLVSFGSGFFSLAAVQVVLENAAEIGEYELYLLPAMRIALIILAALFLVKYLNAFGIFRVLYAVSLLALPFAAALLSHLYQINFRIVSAVLVVVMLCSSLVLWHLLRE